MNARLKPAAFSGLHWVRGELDQSVARARSLIEQHVENPADPLPLQQAYVELHQVRGTAAMIRCIGAAQLAGEMTAGLHDLLRGGVRDPEVLYSALLGGTVQLADYLQALSEDMADCALVLQPAINELRLARGQPVLTEVEVFTGQLQALDLKLPLPEGERAPGALQQQAQRYLAAFQASLLAWIRNAPDAQTAGARIGKIAEQLAQHAARSETHQLWRSAAAAIEALLGRSLDNSLDLKRLFGRVGQQMKLIAEAGEEAAAAGAYELSLQLLFFVGRSRGRGARVQALRQHFQLDAYLPDPAELDARRRRIHGPSTSLLAKVSDEIRADFARVKDHIDLVVRAGGGSADGFAETRQSLRRIADVLGALGLRVLQQTVVNQAQSLEALGAEAGLAQWLTLAESILRVENSLEDALFRQLRPVEGRDELTLDTPTPRDYAEGMQALYRESLVNLARVKQAVDGFLKSGATNELPDAVLLIDEVGAGLEILRRTRVAEAVRRLRRFVASPEFVRLRDGQGLPERFADTIAALEYYIEAERDDSPLTEVLPAQIESFVAAIEAAVARPTLAPADEPPAPDAVPVEPEAAAPEALAAAPPPAAAPTPEPDSFDDEIREVFLEEAGEVLAALRDNLPLWMRDPRDRERLTTIRRCFHTLKGSGRTVGASALGEFAWAIESLLNRCLDGSVPTSTGAVKLVGDAVALLPALIEDFRAGRDPDGAAEALAARAREYAEGRDPDAAGEPDMAAIFREDALDKLGEVRAWLAQFDDHTRSRYPVDELVVRAFHTLRGAARVIDAPAISELAGALEHWLERAVGDAQALDDAGLSLLEAATDTLLKWSEQVGSKAVQQQDARLWIEQIESLQGSVDRLHEDDEARQLAEIFSGEAFDLVQKAEGLINAWAQAPDDRAARQELKVVFHTLTGAALMAQCPAVGNVARALQKRIDEALTADLLPSAGAFAALRDFCEGIYQQLDAYRDGRLHGDGAEFVARIEALAWDTAAPAAVPAAEPAPAAIATEAPAASLVPEVVESLRYAAVPEAPAAAEAAPSDAGTAAAADDAEPIEIPPVAEDEPEPAALLPAPAPVPPALYAVADLGLDPELLHIFIAEAEELLEGYDAAGAALERNPRDPDALDELRRLLHTLKGSARVAGVGAVGEVAHRLETLVDRAGADLGGVTARLQLAGDGLRYAVDDLKRGRLPDLQPLLVELEDVTTATAPAPAAAAADAVPPAEIADAEVPSATVAAGEAPAAEMLAASLPEPLPEPLAATPAGAFAPAAEEAPRYDETAPAVDADLVEIFGGEAVELLEQLERAYARWRVAPAQSGPAQDMQRALHTLKGGARMAGLFAMGDAAHELETRLVALEASGAVQAEALAPVGEAVAALRRMSDQLERRDFHGLLHADKAAVPAPVSAATPSGLWDPELFWRPDEGSEREIALKRETARVPVDALDRMLNDAGEISIYRSRLEEHNSGIQAQLAEMAQTIARVREQLRQLDAETDAQITARGLTQSEHPDRYAGEFDPLEMDRYTRMQELSRALAESVGDLAAVHGSMDTYATGAVTLLQQQGRVNTEVQQGLMRTLMVPFSRQAARLQRVVQQTALENGKRADIVFSGADAELDRNVLERMTAPLEHLLRNAVVHGVEAPDVRAARGKAPAGQIQINLWREGTQLYVEVRDDGAGLDYDAIRAIAIKRGLMPADAQVSDEQAAQFIFMPGFSTARSLTQDAGRGVGMDVVAAEVKQLGGTLELSSEIGRGARFLVRLPLNLALSQALLVEVGGEAYAIPLSSIEGIVRIARDELPAYYADNGPLFAYGGADYRVRHLGGFLGSPREAAGADGKTAHAILVRLPEGIGAGDRRYAVVVDALLGNREIVSKAVGAQISSVPGVSGATILADGRAVLILDVAELAQHAARRALRMAAAGPAPSAEAAATRGLVMVVDDSLTIRRVTERLLTRQGYAVVTAKDGLDAMAQLQSETPAAILLDIEMPRADGFEVAAYVRNTPRIAATPIIMITSRSGEKHRERARALGVNRYLIKPYQEDQLMHELRGVLSQA
ncbi:hybrid sensor histidine kinase/response regulator [Solimonas variicoloris]|uniref:hybrid sensor histidine kinase/response regulator n=1 Tax=Solimonas variicoloris TaxID=254408 RepID=UPI00037F9FAB|nr:Hpt domain-containing protein [Solimonas variicoloris]